MKKIIILTLLGLFIIGAIGMDANAAKKSGKKGGLSADVIQEMSNKIDDLTRKMYGKALYSPQDNQDLIEVKIKLDNQMFVTPDITMAPLYYKAGILYKSREMKSESIDCFQTILENFGDTAFAPKARQQLTDMGIEVQEPVKEGEEGADEAAAEAPVAK